MRTAAPYDLLPAARAALAEYYGALYVDLLLVDYSSKVLQSVTGAPAGGRPLPVRGSAEGRAFDSRERVQTVRHEGSIEMHVPVTAHGDRLGILSVRLPEEKAPPHVVDEITAIADVIGHEILVAERDTDVYLQARRANRLTLAAEVQWDLLPGRACGGKEYAIGAQLEPAYAIYGDNFDWAETENTLTLSVTNGMGEGIQAALLTSLAVNALRNARRAGIGIADQAALADQALFAQYRGEEYVATLLLSFDLDTGRVEVVDGGSPQLWRHRGKTVEHVPFDAQLPLGMFEETDYVTQEFQVVPGDRLVFVSDGVFAALSDKGEAFGEKMLGRAIQAARLLPAAAVPRAILQELSEYLDAGPGPEVGDDALVLCLDWFGRDARA
ncbi:serine/threonine-protein phosphatase [Streptomyces sp. SID14478]|nr:PP2C family protein-serine/threonine phosphatase [Streptomyces sp. SID14478]NEB74675.1 serine/threonine-protein phosphatase [Streptomyces sp. SID14478]